MLQGIIDQFLNNPVKDQFILTFDPFIQIGDQVNPDFPGITDPGTQVIDCRYQSKVNKHRGHQVMRHGPDVLGCFIQRVNYLVYIIQ